MRGAKSRTRSFPFLCKPGPDFERRAQRLGRRLTLNPPGIPTTFLKNARRKKQDPIRFPFYASRAGFRETRSTAWSQTYPKPAGNTYYVSKKCAAQKAGPHSFHYLCKPGRISSRGSDRAGLRPSPAVRPSQARRALAGLSRACLLRLL